MPITAVELRKWDFRACTKRRGVEVRLVGFTVNHPRLGGGASIVSTPIVEELEPGRFYRTASGTVYELRPAALYPGAFAVFCAALAIDNCHAKSLTKAALPLVHAVAFPRDPRSVYRGKKPHDVAPSIVDEAAASILRSHDEGQSRKERLQPSPCLVRVMGRPHRRRFYDRDGERDPLFPHDGTVNSSSHQ